MRWLKALAATGVAVTLGLATAGCTDDDPGGDTAPSAAAPASAAPSMTFDEAYQKVPLGGTKVLPITWDLAGAPDTGEVLAARRTLAYSYGLDQSTDWATSIPLGRYFYTDAYFEKVLAPFVTGTNDNPSIGPLWVKVMGVDRAGPDQATVTFCNDIGYWHRADEKNAKIRKNRANLESYVMMNVESGDGEHHWLADRVFDPDGDRQAKYGAECTKWAQHQP
ncbi:hypothetical protein GCM10010168_77370 [Actinoplanes ianthinogenes]|uniref:Lipoprotein n=1 Tax=Actinoplanes ianthinogenes TaxID=122358 RepID=A0ABN6CT76_9ACTN|nr:hypothetical protein [Actinoplanes ianthinogenes]BCJ48337.1 hypothetical protein Aiant_89940 [Actinoplanes ianthinogenes]GGR47056.1 hypothetical protein GCM10010168_77370 [Actinoplanes ianthinogenes]